MQEFSHPITSLGCAGKGNSSPEEHPTIVLDNASWSIDGIIGYIQFAMQANHHWHSSSSRSLLSGSTLALGLAFSRVASHLRNAPRPPNKWKPRAISVKIP